MKSYAKINLSLDLVSKRIDGYHNISSVMQRIDLADEMIVEKSNEFNFTCDIQLPEINTVTKAYNELVNYVGRELPVSIVLKKIIPTGAGLAGGSANAATLLEEVNRIYNLSLDIKTLRSIGAKVGADVPFMISGKIALCEGIGDIITDIDVNTNFKAVIVNPGFEISSKEIYSKIKINDERMEVKNLIDGLKQKNLEKISYYLRNDMEIVVFKKHPEVENIKIKMKEYTKAALMSGSGSTVYGIFDDEFNMMKAYNYFKEIYEKTFLVNLI